MTAFVLFISESISYFVFCYWEAFGLYWSLGWFWTIFDWLLDYRCQTDLATLVIWLCGWFSTGRWRTLRNRWVHFQPHPNSQELPTASGHLQDIWNCTVKHHYAHHCFTRTISTFFLGFWFLFCFLSIALWNRYPGCYRQWGYWNIKGLLHHSG